MAKFIDLAGRRFGRWTVQYLICKHRENGAPATIWHCKCDCGNEKDIRYPNLISGGSKSCGCLSREQSAKTAKNLSGMTFGRLKVVDRAGSENKRALWLCRCECGKEITVTSNALLTGNTKSCGCIKKEQIGNLSRRHGGSNDRLYEIWKGMKARCNNPKNRSYKNYGGRGISVCEEWNDYVAFRNWAYSSGYKMDAKYGVCTIERIDVNMNYCPENCTWISLSEQMKNKTNSKHHISPENNSPEKK